MDLRKVQKTNDMFYLYLPKRWCRNYNIKGQSLVAIESQSDGTLNIIPQYSKKKPQNLKLTLATEDQLILHKLLVACYISPADSFEINVKGGLDEASILSQKNLLSLEVVEVEGNKITCDSSLTVSDIQNLLITMLRKIKNLILLLNKTTDSALLNRYEEEIDRSKLLIEKSVIAGLTNAASSPQKPVELYFMASLSKELEHLVDHLILIEKPEKKLLQKLKESLDILQTLLQNPIKTLTYHGALQYLKTAHSLPQYQDYDYKRVCRSINVISEVIIDWAVIQLNKEKT